ncbi:MAG TPA: DUF2227 family putative metal-binding protein, partial [Coleofasciculaceae cyanobacterium]
GTAPKLAYYGAATAVGCWFGGLMLSPDLDLPTSNPRRRWLGLGWLWTPYDTMFKHRSIWSHSLILGTSIRAAYFLVLMILLLALADYAISRQWLPKTGLVNWLIGSFFTNPGLALSLYVGLTIADAIHLFLDATVKNRSFTAAELNGIERGD